MPSGKIFLIDSQVCNTLLLKTYGQKSNIDKYYLAF